MSLQYDKDQESLIGKMRTLIREQLPDVTAVDKALKKLISTEWQYTPYEERMSRAMDILGLPQNYEFDSDSERQAVTLLTNFSFNGYKLLYFFLKEWKNELLGQNVGDVFKKSKIRDKKNNELYKDLMENYESKIKDFGPMYSPKVADTCRTYLKDKVMNDFSIADEETAIMVMMKCAIMLRRQYDKSGAFFWDIFTSKDIKKALIPHGQQEENYA